MVSEISGLLSEYGSIMFAAAYAEGHRGRGPALLRDGVRDAKPGPDRDFVHAAVPYMVDRRT